MDNFNTEKCIEGYIKQEFDTVGILAVQHVRPSDLSLRKDGLGCICLELMDLKWMQ